MDEQGGISSSKGEEAQGGAALALFALWSACAPPAPFCSSPTFVLAGLVTSESGLSLHQAAALLANVSGPCWLVAGTSDLSLANAVLDVTVAQDAPAPPPTHHSRQVVRPFVIYEQLLPLIIRPEAPVLVFGGYQRFATTPAMLRESGERFSLVGPSPRASAGPADSPWAAALLPAPERDGFEWAILLGGSVAYDPPWRRDAA